MLIDYKELLKQQYCLYYQILTETQVMADASYENFNGIVRSFSGISQTYHNAIIGFPENDWEKCIHEQISFFNKKKTSFVWYFDKESNSQFTNKLLQNGFKADGVFRGMVCKLDSSFLTFEMPFDCKVELVEDEAKLKEFNDLVCLTFGLQGESKESYKKVLFHAKQNYSMFHWLVRKNGKAISALSTLIKDKVVSIWNQASLPEVRRQGFSTALCKWALRDAFLRGCSIGATYLMADGMAFGIYNNLEFKQKWHLNVFSYSE